MKKLANLKGVKTLNKNEQKLISGGGIVDCTISADPSTDWCCHLRTGCP